MVLPIDVDGARVPAYVKVLSMHALHVMAKDTSYLMTDAYMCAIVPTRLIRNWYWSVKIVSTTNVKVQIEIEM